MSDSYRIDIDRIQRLLVSIKNDLNKREQKKKAYQPVALIEGEIRGQLTNLERELDLFKAQIVAQERKSQSAVMQRELERKRNQYSDFFNQKEDLKNKFNCEIQQAKLNQESKPKSILFPIPIYLSQIPGTVRYLEHDLTTDL